MNSAADDFLFGLNDQDLLTEEQIELLRFHAGNLVGEPIWKVLSFLTGVTVRMLFENARSRFVEPPRLLLERRPPIPDAPEAIDALVERTEYLKNENAELRTRIEKLEALIRSVT